MEGDRLSIKQDERVREITIPHDAKIFEALRRMDSTNRKLLILERNGKFFSLLSIGDIQRAIIRNVSLDTPVYRIVRQNIRIAHPTDSFEKIREMMLEHRMEFLPVIDNGDIVSVYFWEDVFGKSQVKTKGEIDVPVVIMAGGKGTRLKPITNVIPKPLIPIGEKTILEMIINRFHKYGVKDFYISLNYKSEMIKYYLENLNLKDINIHYLEEQVPLGTAGSLSLLREKVKGRCFVTNCDILVNEDYKEVLDYHIESESLLTIVGVIKTETIPYGLIESDENGRVIGINEKPTNSYIFNSGMYIVEEVVLDLIPENEFLNMTDLVSKLINSGQRVSYFPVSENSWFDIGEWDKYLKTLENYELVKRFFENW